MNFIESIHPMENELIFGQCLFLSATLLLFLDDIFQLRVVAIAISLLTIIFDFLLYYEPHWLIIQWNAIFILIHLFRLSSTYLQRFDIHFTPEERKLYESVFTTLTKAEFKKLTRIAAWKELASGTRIVSQGEKINALRVVSQGKARVLVNDQLVAHVHAGGFIGEVGFLSDGLASATVVAEGPMTVMIWTSHQFQAILDRNPLLNAKTQQIFGTDLVQKLKTTDKELGRAS